MKKIIFPICNNKPERAPKIFGHTFIFCWRCTMVIVGVVLTRLFLEVTNILLEKQMFLWGTVLCIPMIIDGLRQYWRNISSTNYRRAFTGLAFGIGVTLFVSTIEIIYY